MYVSSFLLMDFSHDFPLQIVNHPLYNSSILGNITNPPNRQGHGHSGVPGGILSPGQLRPAAVGGLGLLPVEGQPAGGSTGGAGEQVEIQVGDGGSRMVNIWLMNVNDG